MMKRRSITPSDDDVRLFREAIGSVRKLTPVAETVARPQPAPDATQSKLDEANVVRELLTHEYDPASIEVGDEIYHLKTGAPTRLLKELRRGQYSIRSEIDLHQMTVEVAREAIQLFLDDCHARGELCVKIIHGKGLRSKSRGPVLKRLTDSVLRKRGDVLAFASARPAQGGTGAVVVLLQRR